MTPEEVKRLTDLIQSATEELHRAVERQDAEIKKLGEPTAENKAVIDTINTNLTDLKTRLDEMDVKMQRQALPGAGDPNPKSDEEKANSAAFYNWIRGGTSALEPAERKALVEDVTGQYLVTPELEAEIERTLPTLTIIRPLVTKRSITKDRLKLRSLSEVSVGWGKLETGTDITESAPVPGAPTYQYVEDLYGLAKIGEDELEDSDINLQAILADSFSRAIAEAEETAFAVGAGHDSEEPEGMTVNATILAATRSVTTAGTALIEDFLSLIYDCPAQYRKNGAFMVKSSTELALRVLRGDGGGGAGTGNFLWQPSVQAGRPNTFLGYPIYVQEDLAALASAVAVIAIFGDFRQGYRILDRKGITLQRLVELYSEAGLIGFKIHKRVGGAAIMPSKKALCLLSDKA